MRGLSFEVLVVSCLILSGCEGLPFTDEDTQDARRNNQAQLTMNRKGNQIILRQSMKILLLKKLFAST